MTQRTTTPKPAVNAHPERHRTRWTQCKRLVRLALIGVAALAAMALAGVLLVAALRTFVVTQEDLLHLMRFSRWFHAIGVTVQCLAVLAIYARWQRIVTWARSRGFVLESEFERALAFRGRVIAFLVLYLVLIPIGPARIWMAFFER